MKPQSIGILGGTFNPIHAGHIRLARHVQETLQLDRVLIIPDRIPPHKEAVDLLPGRDRLELCRIACAPYPQLEVSDIELQREGNSYTVDTLTALREKYPKASLTLIAGSDMFLTIDTWKNSGKIFRLAQICTGARESPDILRLKEKKKELEKLGAVCRILDLPVFEVSSTQIRKAVSLGAGRKYLSAWMSREEAEHILKRGFYQNGEPERDSDCLQFLPLLQEKLSRKRLFHCRCVADMSQELAERFLPGQIDSKKARLAGLLHDICREDPEKKQLELIQREGLESDPIFFRIPAVWHGFAAAAYLKGSGRITDEEILNAIRFHTTARKNMSPLEQIVFVADGISLDRVYPGVQELRASSRNSIQEGMLAMLKYSISSLMENNLPIGKYTWEAFNQLVLAEKQDTVRKDTAEDAAYRV